MRVFIGLMVIVFSLMGCAAHQQDKLTQPTIIIHLNQVALEAKGPKIAIIASSEPLDLKQTNFHIVTEAGDENSPYLLSGSLTVLGDFTEWKNAYKNQHQQYYYQADFSHFSSIGRFKLSIDTGHELVFSHAIDIEKQALFNKTITAILDYFHASRNDEKYNYQQDKHIRIFGTDRFVDVRGGYNDAGGDTGKYLSHLSYANFFNPQQLALVTWALGHSYQQVPKLYQAQHLSQQVIEEVFWGADYLHRILDKEGYFYMTVFDQWNTNNAERVVTAYVGEDGVYSEDYQSAFRQGAGSAIAALAQAAIIAKASNQQGEYSAQQYLVAAEKAFHHLQDNNAENNKRYADDGKENIIDDYTALLAATELFKATEDPYYLNAANARADNLQQRITPQGWFISNDIHSDNLRPFYHGAEAGFPIVALGEYLTVAKDSDKKAAVKQVINRNLAYQLALNKKVSNPFNYARQSFKTYKNGVLSPQYQEGFFIPHANETLYWWQGESARLSSLATAALMGGRITYPQEKNAFGVSHELAVFAQNQLDWTLGRNPYDVSMLYGFGAKNPVPYEGLTMVKGGISNGITGAKNSDAGRGIEFAPEPDWHNWRWVEQWLPHSTWFLLAVTEMAKHP